MGYTFQCSSKCSFDETIDPETGELKAAGFGIFSEIDEQEALNKKTECLFQKVIDSL